MNARETMARLGEEDRLETVTPHWDEAAAEYPADGLAFLSDAAMEDHWEWSGFEEPLPGFVRDAARKIEKDEALSAFAWYCYWRIYRGPPSVPTNAFPRLENTMGEHCGAFYLLQAMAMVPLVRERHARMGVPEEITRNTCLQIEGHCGNYRRGHGGTYGLCRKQAQWHGNYLKRNLFRIGRFEFMTFKAPGAIEVYRRRDTRRVVALAADGTEVTASGHIAREGDMPRAFTTSLARDGDAVTGCAVSPEGYIIREEMRLPLDEWECVLKEGDAALQMHIPPGGGMTFERCRESLQAAPVFFRRYVPDCPVTAIVCTSWIFNSQLQEILGADANMSRLQREVYLYPIRSTPTAGFWFVFLQEPFDAATAPRETSLQRAILDFVAGGTPWRSGGMFILPEDLEHFGAEHYRRTVDI